MSARHAELSFAADHPVFAGHFPGRPIIPGALLLDEVLRAAGPAPGAGWKLAAVKFTSPVGPGEAVAIEIDAAAADGAQRFRVLVDGRVAASGSLAPRLEQA
jgi:3-hydroxymyristoyl/3-hydroxydecanoyl-(acyl carrier protein) dehydratase